MNLAACGTLPRTPENGVWYRAVLPGHLATALSAAHARAAPSRFNPGSLLPAAQQFATLYFADDPMVALFEVRAILGDPAPGGHLPHPRVAFVTLNVRILLGAVVDLSDVGEAQRPLETSVQELTGDWSGYRLRGHRTPVSQPTGIASIQDLGIALHAAGVEGFRAVSARVPYHKTLVVFPESLRRGSLLEFADPSGAIVHRIGP